MLPKVKKANMAGMMEAIKEYLRLCHRVKRATLTYVIRKKIAIEACAIYPWYATPNDVMIASMLHIPKRRVLSIEITWQIPGTSI